MTDASEFQALMRSVRCGDADAAAQLVRQYEAELRIIARVKLKDPRLRRAVDSMDICQSIFANFFFRATMGQFEIETQEQLMKLLGAMVRNKVIDCARRQSADRRDMGRMAVTPIDELPIAANINTPSQVIVAGELLQLARQQFAADEWQLVECRREGKTWDEIATALGGAPEALRKKMSRAVDRVAEHLHLDSSTCFNRSLLSDSR